MKTNTSMDAHPLSGIGITAKNFKCFGDLSLRLDKLLPINIFIGRNNSGKSSILDVLRLCAESGKSYRPDAHARKGNAYSIEITQALEQSDLAGIFSKNTSGGQIPGNHWAYGRQFLGRSIRRTYETNWHISQVEVDGTGISPTLHNQFREQLGQRTRYPFENVHIIEVDAERRVSPEPRDTSRSIEPNGKGVTNLIRAFLHNDDLPATEVEQELLRELNEVYAGDCEFRRIVCLENEQSSTWEIFLNEDIKGDVRLSESGSSLQSIFIVLATLRLAPLIKQVSWSQVLLALEEPENNLHPALLRRLLDFIARRRKELGFTLCITTHSPIAIDWSSRRHDSQIVHVRQHQGESVVSRAMHYRENCAVLDDLDIRASDILQANGVIWVEGPSDRLYLRRWIDLVSDGVLKEGTHYSIMYYGGKLLSHLSLSPPGTAEQLISILSINRNAGVVIDSDRKPSTGDRRPKQRLNETKQRIKTEVEKLRGFVWITEGREVENYIPPAVLGRLANVNEVSIDIYDPVIENENLIHFKRDKIELALRASETTEKEDLSGHLDLTEKVEALCNEIRKWNHIET